MNSNETLATKLAEFWYKNGLEKKYGFNCLKKVLINKQGND